MILPYTARQTVAAGLGNYGIAYTSFPVRMRQMAATENRAASIPAERFIDLCESFGASGCQMDVGQLSSTAADYLKRVRARAEAKGMFLELSVGGKVLGDEDAFSRAAWAARELGVKRLRTALLNGRRYEDFAEMRKWQDFVDYWKSTLRRIEPALRRHELLMGVENHKDWLADELAEMLGRISSPYLGACVDFGNNLALLEDSLEVARKLAPYAVTTHLKDMAVRPDDSGFELSEVPLGDGFLPLGQIVEILRRSRPDIHFCLEMITRDPLKVPYRQDKYWITYEKRDPARVRKIETLLRDKARAAPLPRVSDLPGERMLAAEDDNLRRSAAYAKNQLKL